MPNTKSLNLSYIPGSSLLKPCVLAAMILLVLNDHVLKSAIGNAVTGKLSDFAGLLFFPVLLHGILQILFTSFFDRPRRSNVLLIICVWATGIVFTGIQVSVPWAEGYQYSLGFIRWVLGLGFLHDSPILIVRHWPDFSDLIALPVLLISLRVGWRPCLSMHS